MAIVISALALGLSAASFFVTLLLTLRRDALGIMPVLAFTYREAGWFIENVGNGPALDVVFRRVDSTHHVQHVRLPTIAKGESVRLHFARHDAKCEFAAVYADALGRKYSSRSLADVSSVLRGAVFDCPTVPQDLPRWWQLPESPSTPPATSGGLAASTAEADHLHS
jgi:hypothetical protein